MRLLQNLAAGEVTRLKPQEFKRSWNFLASAAAVLKEIPMLVKFPGLPM